MASENFHPGDAKITPKNGFWSIFLPSRLYKKAARAAKELPLEESNQPINSTDDLQQEPSQTDVFKEVTPFSPDLVASPKHEHSFKGRNKEYLAKHADEPKPTDTGPFAVAIVSRAYRELSNGNLTERLLSLVSQKIPTSEFKAYIAVNNVRVHAIAAEVCEREKEKLEGLTGYLLTNKIESLVLEVFTQRGLTMTYDDIASLQSAGKAPLETRIKDYKENQATLRVLNALTIAVNTVQSGGNEEDILAKTFENIEKSAREFLSENQLQVLLRAARMIVKKRIAVMGVDCSSFSKAYEETNHGQATNEACHIAMSQGAKYIDVSDMDEYHGPDALQEILEIAQQGSKVDVLIRPLTVVVPQHPEQIIDTTKAWSSLVEFYAKSLSTSKKSYGNTGNKSSGSQIVSAHAFIKHQYPEIGYNEDYGFADTMRGDKKLVIRRALRSDLKLATRGRDVSWDGGHASEAVYQQAEKTREFYTREQRSTINSLCSANLLDEKNLATYNKTRGIRSPDLLKMYREQRAKFFRKNQEERIQLRRIFLGIRRDGKINPKGILPVMYRTLQDHPDWSADQIIQQTQVGFRYKSFFDQNPLIVKGVLQEMQRIQSVSLINSNLPDDVVKDELPLIFQQSTSHILSLASLTEHIVNSLPELFGPPLTQEPVYDAEGILNLPTEEINIANWHHLFQADQWLKSYVTNLLSGGILNPITKRALERLPKFY